jgi:hypothetical protein
MARQSHKLNRVTGGRRTRGRRWHRPTHTKKKKLHRPWWPTILVFMSKWSKSLNVTPITIVQEWINKTVSQYPIIQYGLVRIEISDLIDSRNRELVSIKRWSGKNGRTSSTGFCVSLIHSRARESTHMKAAWSLLEFRPNITAPTHVLCNYG